MVLMARAVRRIQETAAYLSAVVESSDDAIVTKDLQGVRRLRPPVLQRGRLLRRLRR